MRRSGPIPRRKRIKRTTARLTLAHRLDKEIRNQVLERDGHRCVKCGRGEPEVVLQAAHILPKGRAPRMRFEVLNILCLCVGCHIFGAHRDPLGFANWLNEAYPGLYDRLLVIAATARRIDMKELAIVLGVK